MKGRNQGRQLEAYQSGKSPYVSGRSGAFLLIRWLPITTPSLSRRSSLLYISQQVHNNIEPMKILPDPLPAFKRSPLVYKNRVVRDRTTAPDARTGIRYEKHLPTISEYLVSPNRDRRRSHLSSAYFDPFTFDDDQDLNEAADEHDFERPTFDWVDEKTLVDDLRGLNTRYFSIFLVIVSSSYATSVTTNKMPKTSN